MATGDSGSPKAFLSKHETGGGMKEQSGRSLGERQTQFLLTVILALIVLLTLSRPTWAQGVVPPQPERWTGTMFDASKLSAVEFFVDFKDHQLWPYGCVEVVRAEAGTSFTVKLTNANRKKYLIEILGKEEKIQKESVPEALKSVIGTLEVGAPKGDVKALRTPCTFDTFDNALKCFDESISEIEKVAKALDEAAAVEAEAESYDQLQAGEFAQLKVADICSTMDESCRGGLMDVEKRIKGLVEGSAMAAKAMESKHVPKNLAEKYALDVADSKLKAAMQLLVEGPKIAKSLADHWDPSKAGAIKDTLFTTVTTTEFTGAPLTIDVSVKAKSKEPVKAEGGAKPQAAAETLYKMQIRVMPTRVNAFTFSSGFFFSGLVDHSYTVRDGRIARRGGEDEILPAVGVLAHWHPSSDWWAISAGIAGKGSELEYLVGASLLSGKTQRFVVSVGAAVGSVKRLDGVEVGDALSSTTVPTRDVVRVSWFGGISFRF